MADLATASKFLRDHHRAVLATFRMDGRPQLSPVTCAIDPDGRVLISTRETAIKTRNLRRDPRVSLCAFSDQFFGDWIQVDGMAEVIPLPEAMDLLVEYYRLAAGEHDDWEEYRAAMARERRVVLRITISRVGPDVSG
jgi:PPOX class probable F420-dependent enzyme